MTIEQISIDLLEARKTQADAVRAVRAARQAVRDRERDLEAARTVVRRHSKRRTRAAVRLANSAND